MKLALRPWLTAAALLGGLGLGLPSARATIVERIVAVVGDDPILLSDVRNRSRPFLVRIYQEVPDGPQRSAAITQVYKLVLERMIDEELEDRAAARAGIVVTSQEIDQALARIAAQNGMTEQQILAEAQQSGLTVAQYRDELRRQVLQAKMSSLRLQGRVRVDEEDVEAAYRELEREERLRLPQRTLRLALARGTTPEQEAKQLALAESLAERARAGEDFAELIAKYATAAGSGAAPPAPPVQEPEAVRRATLPLEVGQVSRPVRLGGSIVLLQVVERAPSQLPPYQQARDAMQERVYMEKLAKARQHWLEGLRRRTHIEVRM